MRLYKSKGGFGLVRNVGRSGPEALPPATTITRNNFAVFQRFRWNPRQDPAWRRRVFTVAADDTQVVGVIDLHESGMSAIICVDDPAIVFIVLAAKQAVDFVDEAQQFFPRTWLRRRCFANGVNEPVVVRLVAQTILEF